MVKIDKRKKYIAVLDVETAGDVQKNPLIYDFGFTITDKKGFIYEKFSFLIEEIFQDDAVMSTAYYAEKIPRYLEGLEKGEYTLKPFAYARQVFLNKLKEYGVTQISAYNLRFDYNALNNTAFELTTKYKYFLPYYVTKKMNFVDVWALACQTIFKQKSFKDFAIENKYYTEKGNYQTSAEIAYRYMTRNNGFIEEHTGLSDSLIEAEIMAWCYRQKKKIYHKFENKDFQRFTWKHVTEFHGKVITA